MSFFRGIEGNWTRASYLLTAGSFLSAVGYYLPLGRQVHLALMISAGVIVLFNLLVLALGKERDAGCAAIVYAVLAASVHIGAYVR